MRRSVALLCSLVVCAIAAPAAWAGPDASVTSTAPDEGMVVQHSGVAVNLTRSDTVDSTNLAQAYSHDCTGCEAIAASFQAVIAVGHPSNVVPQNVALAVNSSCTSCRTFAYAYQYVVSTDHLPQLTSDDRSTLRDFREQAAELATSELPFPELDARLHDLAQRFRAAVDAALARAHVHGHGDSDEHVEQHGEHSGT
jgi:hypothetical protein